MTCASSATSARETTPSCSSRRANSLLPPTKHPGPLTSTLTLITPTITCKQATETLEALMAPKPPPKQPKPPPQPHSASAAPSSIDGGGEDGTDGCWEGEEDAPAVASAQDAAVAANCLALLSAALPLVCCDFSKGVLALVGEQRICSVLHDQLNRTCCERLSLSVYPTLTTVGTRGHREVARFLVDGTLPHPRPTAVAAITAAPPPPSSSASSSSAAAAAAVTTNAAEDALSLASAAASLEALLAQERGYPRGIRGHTNGLVQEAADAADGDGLDCGYEAPSRVPLGGGDEVSPPAPFRARHHPSKPLFRSRSATVS